MGWANQDTHDHFLQSSAVGARAIVHDQSHLEVCLDYPLPQFNHVKYSHKIDFFFFIPKVMGISSSSYPRERFYSDMTNYIRAHTPYRESGEWQILAEITSAIDQRLESTPIAELDQTSEFVKLFANTLNKRLKEGFDQFQGGAYTSVQHLFDIDLVLQNFRKQCVHRVEQPTLKIPAELRKTILLVDEYLSNRIESTFAEINACIDKRKATSLTIEIRYQIRRILEKELEYRKSRNNRFFIKKNSESEREYFYYRQSLLKKFVAHPLYLTIQKKKQERRYRNMIASFGAALAGVWTQLADHHTYKAAKASDIGLQFITVACIAVIIYVFKDRIKDLSKEYVNEKLKDKIPDYKGFVSHPNFGGIGNTEEYVRFLDEKSTAPEIRFLRRLEGRWDVEPPLPDTVLHYHRSVHLENGKRKKHPFEITAIKDIFRFNFSYFLKHLDDPIKQLATYDLEDGATLVNAPKVYHLNLVMRMTTSLGSSNHVNKRVDFEIYRLIFNKFGIIRMESLSNQHRLFYLEGEA